MAIMANDSHYSPLNEGIAKDDDLLEKDHPGAKTPHRTYESLD